MRTGIRNITSNLLVRYLC